MNDTRVSRLGTASVGLGSGAAAVLLAVSAVGLFTPPAAATDVRKADTPTVTVKRGKPARTLPFVADRAGRLWYR
ncbi:hypothetical protein NRF20_06730 [Streptomyces sp. R-74717]|uniref:hypothetical protein n=1 Tax=Streptomyces TaxID=1883 RepID=UPI0037A82399